MDLFILVFFILLYILIVSLLNRNLGIISLVFISLLLSVFIGSRSMFAGNDTIHYYNFINYMSKYGWTDFFEYYPRFKFEFFFWGWVKFLTLFTTDAKCILIITAFFSILILLYSVCKLSTNSCAAISFMLVTFSFYSFFGNVIRHGMAISFYLLCVLYLSKNQHVKSLFFSFCSAFSHIAGSFSFAPILLSLFKVSRFKLFFIAIVFSFFAYYILGFLSTLPQFYALNFYLGNSGDSVISGSLLLSTFILLGALLNNKDRHNYFIINVYILIFILSLSVSNIPAMAYRVSMMRFILEPIILSCFFGNHYWSKITVFLSSVCYLYIMINYTSTMSFLG
ncbi:hypothetical protein C0W42_01500 [Photobacterium kishitanii]|uniref:EpsG family protein n=1 Tax=Photobacterium kishitanii TaxID=318456 RepID=UPI000D15A212|nr:EpsG family protein [Photobacterium kishitanii]PSU92809.1 hypothetical protein C0W42_01500 [Photobacterium kishitanii]